jgi:hypothetical protein
VPEPDADAAALPFEEMLGAVVAWGDERGLEARVRELDADEVVMWPFAAAHDPAASLPATLDAIQEPTAR